MTNSRRVSKHLDLHIGPESYLRETGSRAGALPAFDVVFLKRPASVTTSHLVDRIEASLFVHRTNANDMFNFFLDMERRPLLTFNHYYTDNVQKARTEAISAALKQANPAQLPVAGFAQLDIPCILVSACEGYRWEDASRGGTSTPSILASQTHSGYLACSVCPNTRFNVVSAPVLSR